MSLCRSVSLSFDPGDPRSRQQRVPDRTSPVRHYSPLPRINPSSPSHSREGSPTAFPADSYGHHRQQQQPNPASFRQHPSYPDSQSQRQQPQPSSDPHRQQAVPDPRDSPNANHNGYPSRSKSRERDREGGGREEEGEEEEEEEGGYPSRSHRSYKEKIPQTSPRRGREAHGVTQGRHRPGPDDDDYEGREEDLRNADRVPPPPLDRESPEHSPEQSPVRKGAAAQAYRGANGYERDAAYTNNTNEDSGFAGLTPEDQYKNRDKENFYDGLNR